jgi:uncharacterized protein YjbI with pentapeptide repeats
MDENHRDKVESELGATEVKLWLPPLSTRDQKKLDHFQKKRFPRWTGFAHKTLWDWLQLLAALAVPFVVTILGLYFTQQITQQQTQASERQHQTDLQIAQDQERETTLKTYLDDMSGLLLNYNLRKSKSGDEMRQLARERTLTTLRRLDADRNMIVLQFLQDAHLIGEHNAVIDLSGTNLSGVDLSGTNLGGVDLSDANLGGVDLSDANLSGATLDYAHLNKADLNKADLSGADLSGAILSGAILTDVNLRRADLSGVDLSDANLSGATLLGANLRGAFLREANLSGVDLSDATLTDADLSGATLTDATLKGATMPDGSKHP